MPGQIIFHLAGQYAIVRKDNLSDTLEKAMKWSDVFQSVAPKSFSLPASLSVYQVYARSHPGFFVLKLANAARGEGVTVLHSDDPFKVKDAVIQEYIPNPLLINGKKFDLRLYVAVTSVEPLVAYLYEEGLTRFATSDFEPPTKKNKNAQTVHLTNYSVNKGADLDISEFKWKLTDVLKYLDENYKGTAREQWKDIFAEDSPKPTKLPPVKPTKFTQQIPNIQQN